MKQCPKCLSMHDKSGTFCGRKCANSRTWNTEHKKRLSNTIVNSLYYKQKYGEPKPRKAKRAKKARLVQYCIRCLSETPYSIHRVKYCSKKCQTLHYREKMILLWEDGNHNGMCGTSSIAKWLRRYLLECVGHKCELCGWGERNSSTNTIPLDVHHIDGDYTNNVRQNLQVLCPNCHSLTASYKSANKKKGRPRSKYWKNAF